MNSAMNQLYSQFHFKSPMNEESLKESSAQIVRDIQSLVDDDLEIDVFVEPVSKSKKLFEVRLRVVGLGEAMVTSKQGKNPISLLKKNRRVISRRIKRFLRSGRRRKGLDFRSAV